MNQPNQIKCAECGKEITGTSHPDPYVQTNQEGKVTSRICSDCNHLIRERLEKQAEEKARQQAIEEYERKIKECEEKQKKNEEEIRHWEETIKPKMVKGECIKLEDIRWLISEETRKIIDDYNDKLQALEHEKNFYEAFNQIRNGEQINLSQIYCNEKQIKTLKVAQEIVNKRWIRGQDTTWIDKLEYTYEYYDERGIKHYLQLELGTKYKELLKDLQKEIYQSNNQDTKNLPGQNQEGYLVDCQKCRKKYNLNYVPPHCQFCQSRQIQVWKNGLLQLLPIEQSNQSDPKHYLCHSCQKVIQSGETCWTNPDTSYLKTCDNCHQIQQIKIKQARTNKYLVDGLLSFLLIGLIIGGLIWLLRRKKKIKQ